MSKFFADGHLRYQEGAWRDDDGDAVEIQPVRHGRWKQWKPKYIGMEYSYDTMVCSVCEFKMGNAKIIPAHYCPNCGAKMDGGGGE